MKVHPLPNVVHHANSQLWPLWVILPILVYMVFDFSGVGIVAGSQIDCSEGYGAMHTVVVLSVR